MRWGAIKPIDLQIMIPRIPEVSKISNEAAERNVAFQQQQVVNTQSQVEANMTGVYARERAQGGKIREKQEKDHEKGKGKQGQDKNRKQRQKDTTCIIDIRV